MRKIIYTLVDGGVAVVHPVINTIGEVEGFTEADAEQRAWDSLPADAINPKFIDADAIPADRTFRDAWLVSGDKLDHDIGRVKEIAHTMRRAKRNEEFAPFDEIIAKQIPGMSAQDAAAERAAIRAKHSGIQASIDAAADVQAVKAVLVEHIAPEL